MSIHTIHITYYIGTRTHRYRRGASRHIDPLLDALDAANSVVSSAEPDADDDDDTTCDM
jgi:hypothetical protein|tara:strand:- start:188 stop:364 length:177 start_codon:yes stop_codon:yes gene_type:complete